MDLSFATYPYLNTVSGGAGFETVTVLGNTVYFDPSSADAVVSAIPPDLLQMVQPFINQYVTLTGSAADMLKSATAVASGSGSQAEISGTVVSAANQGNVAAVGGVTLGGFVALMLL
ncbi:hypothetical protein DICA3_D05688 [Diutina catenulata]